ncbi:MAG: DUF1573 domain-containing protein [Gemmataceae bacterium]
MSTAVLTSLMLLSPAQVPAPPQPQSQDPSAATAWAAKIFRDASGNVPSGHDFGTVPKGAQLLHRFPMTNIYAVPLQILTRVSCDCVSVTASPQTLQPRESGTLDIAMDTRKFNGSKQVTVYVTVVSPVSQTQQQFSSTATLSITGFCRGDVTLNPGQAQFGVVSRGQPAERTVDITYAGQQNWQTWKLEAVVAGDSAPFDVRYQELARRPGQVTYRVALALKADTAPGSLKGDLQLQSNDPNNRLVPVPYDVTVQAPLRVSPEFTNFGTVRVGEPQSRRIILSGNKPFKVLAVDGKADGVIVEGSTAALQVHTLTIKYTPTAPGALANTLVIKTDLDGGATVTARLGATAAAQ